MRGSISLFLLFLLGWGSAFAEYEAIGKIEGQVCHGFFIESCKLVSIVAVEGEDGQLHEIAKKYAEVSEYRESDKRCWIYVESKGAGLLSSAANFLFGVNFYVLAESGKYEEVAIEYLVFDCRKT